MVYYLRYLQVSGFPLPDQVKDKLRGNDNFLKRKLCRRNPDKFHLL